MGVTFDQIVGPRSMWGIPGSWSLHLTHKAYQRYRENEIASAINRTTRVWVTYSAGGSAAGGGGTGAIGTPYLVRHTADLKTLTANVLALLGTGVGVIIPDDVVIPGSQANTDQSIINWGANVSWGRGGLGTRKPEISGFVGVQPDSTAGTVATFNLGAGVSCYGVRGRLAASTSRDDYYLQPYKYAASAVEATATDYSMFSDSGTGVTIVNFGAHDSTRLELSFNTGIGLYMGDYDQCAIDGLIITGFGMNARGTASGNQVVKWQLTGTNTNVARDCDWAWGPYHTGGNIVTGTGGILTMHRCRWGYHQWDSGGTGDGCIHYTTGGAQEFGRYDCANPWGGLDTVAGIAIPQTAYAHTANDTTSPISYGAEIDCSYSPDVGALIQSNTICASVGAITNKDLTSQYRLYTYNREVAAKSMSSGGFWGIHYRAENTTAISPPGGSFAIPFSGSTPLKGLWFSSEFVVFVVAGTWTSKSIRVFQSTSAHNFRWNFCRFRLTGANANSLVVGGDFANAGYFKTCSLENCVLSNETAITSGNITWTQANGMDHFWNANPRVETGGLSGCAYWGMAAAQFTSTLGTLALAAAADWTTAAAVPAAMQNAALALPVGLTCELDHLGMTRNTSYMRRSRGSIEAIPVSQNDYVVGVTKKVELILKEDL